ncbi:MAG: transposase [Candidatus Hydrogenedentes bacterium]|nr:transposase [Candidatus Hydrogenedentota bacterium]
METNECVPDDVFIPFDRTAELAIHGRHLPHWRQDGVTYFVTFRLADSVPRSKVRSWKEEREQWLKRHPKPWSIEEMRSYGDFYQRFEKWLDAGDGSRILADKRAGELVASALHHFDGERYILDSYTIMPNHVHVLVRAYDAEDLSKHLHTWKSFTAHELNKLLHRSGTVWQGESFDHIVRSAPHLEHFRKYIEENPRKAGIASGYLIGCGLGVK